MHLPGGIVRSACIAGLYFSFRSCLINGIGLWGVENTRHIS